MKAIVSSSGIIILIVVFGLYVTLQLYHMLEGLMAKIAFSSKTKRTVWIRRIYWSAAKFAMRNYIANHCHYLVPWGNAIECIAMYELDRVDFKLAYLEGGMDKLKVEVLTKTEQITMFVIEWKAAYQVATTKEMLSLYLIENKNE